MLAHVVPVDGADLPANIGGPRRRMRPCPRSRRWRSHRSREHSDGAKPWELAVVRQRMTPASRYQRWAPAATTGAAISTIVEHIEAAWTPHDQRGWPSSRRDYGSREPGSRLPSARRQRGGRRPVAGRYRPGSCAAAAAWAGCGWRRTSCCIGPSPQTRHPEGTDVR